jgi:hypothetical protein
LEEQVRDAYDNLGNEDVESFWFSVWERS